MTHESIARGLLAILCGAQGAATLAIDLNRTHATNPRWTGHARFHLVWQTVSYALLAILEVELVLAAGPWPEQRFYLAAMLASIPMLSFLGAFFFQKRYGGALYDSNGILPARVRAFGSEFHIDLNLAVEIAAILVLLASVALFRH